MEAFEICGECQSRRNYAAKADLLLLIDIFFAYKFGMKLINWSSQPMKAIEVDS